MSSIRSENSDSGLNGCPNRSNPCRRVSGRDFCVVCGSEKTKDTQTGDQPICVPYQEEGEMKKNCYALIIHGRCYGNNGYFMKFL